MHLRIVAFLLTVGSLVSAQSSHWAAPDDSTAKYMIDSERQWAEAACTRNRIADTILADDFQGTSTDSARYTKQEELASTSDPKVEVARNCQLIDAKVRFFSDNLALVYGSESSIRKSKDGKDMKHCQIWTDTWLKRDGKWQIIAAQDTRYECSATPQP